MAGIAAVALVIAFLMLQLTTPQMVGPLGVLAFFILIYIASTGFLFIGLSIVNELLKRYLPKGRLLLSAEATRQIKIYYYASILGLAPVILIGMRSVGDIGLAEVLLLIAFEVIGCFYISKRF